MTATVFEARSLKELGEQRDSQAIVRGGSDFDVEISTNAPIGAFMGLPLLPKLLFRQFTPPGMVLVDVQGRGVTGGLVKYQVDVDAGQAGEFGFVLTLGILTAFLASNWVRIIIIGFVLDFILKRITGRGVVATVAGPVGDILKPALIVGAAIVAVSLVGGRK